MAEEIPDEHVQIERRIVGLYNLLYEDSLTRDDIEFYEIEEPDFEGEVYLPSFGLNVQLWREWSTEKRVEVLIHEFAHTENYEDDHHPSFWNRVVERTEIATSHATAVEDLFEADLNPHALKEAVVESVHEHVIEPDVDSVEQRRRELGDALGVSPESVDAE